MITTIRTHTAIDRSWCGTPTEIAEGRAVVEWRAPEAARVDGEGLVHGGFTFGVVDHAAMLAVNDPLVVLVGASTRFLAPVAVGDVVVAEARVISAEGRRRRVECVARVGQGVVLDGTLECAVARAHPLEARTEGAS